MGLDIVDGLTASEYRKNNTENRSVDYFGRDNFRATCNR